MVVNVPDFCLDEVSDHAMALLLACARRIVPFASATRGRHLGPARHRPRAATAARSAARHRRVRQHRPRTGAEGAGLRPRRARLHAAIGAGQRWLGRAHDERSRRAAGLLGLRLGARTGDARDARADRRGRAARDEADGLPGEHLTRRARRRGRAAPGTGRGLDRRRRARRARAGAPACGASAARPGERDRDPARGLLLGGGDRGAGHEGRTQRRHRAARRGAGDDPQPVGSGAAELQAPRCRSLRCAARRGPAPRSRARTRRSWSAGTPRSPRRR